MSAADRPKLENWQRLSNWKRPRKGYPFAGWARDPGVRRIFLTGSLAAS
jgi:hypothetical protein